VDACPRALLPCPGRTGADQDRREVNEIAVVKTYEALYIIDPNLTDEQITAITDKYSNVVTQLGGEVLTVERWDKRRLAYDVKGYGDGAYILMYFTSETTTVAEMDRVMKISEDVIRHLIVVEENGQAAASKERVSRPQPKPAEVPAPVIVAPIQEEAPEAEPVATVEEAAPAEEVAEEAPVAEAEAPAEEPVAEPVEEPAVVEEVVETKSEETPEETPAE
jgi:small subunit ribosomal protein S6